MFLIHFFLEIFSSRGYEFINTLLFTNFTICLLVEGLEKLPFIFLHPPNTISIQNPKVITTVTKFVLSTKESMLPSSIESLKNNNFCGSEKK